MYIRLSTTRILANCMTLPGKALAVIKVNIDLKPEQSGQMYEIEPN